jgi:formate dehydrogenase subunit delta
MEIARLVHKANQIADFFKAYPEDEAVTAVANHLKQFWDPRMRSELAKHLEAGGEGLEPISRAAAKALLQQDSTPH